MAKIVIKKTGINSFTCPYASDQDTIRKYGIGEELMATIKKPRHLPHHKKFFALLQVVYENLPEHLEIDSVDLLLWHIKIQLGYFDQVSTLGGKITYREKSISFESMDQVKFTEFYDNAIDVILKYFLPEGAKREELELMVIDFT